MVVPNGRKFHPGQYGSPGFKANDKPFVSNRLQSWRKTPRPVRIASVQKHRDESGEVCALTVTEHFGAVLGARSGSLRPH